tara:strand:- start:641 stop:859 length:219 start_codon:yes stop_codon:yes gene_type:complete
MVQKLGRILKIVRENLRASDKCTRRIQTSKNERKQLMKKLKNEKFLSLKIMKFFETWFKLFVHNFNIKLTLK